VLQCISALLSRTPPVIKHVLRDPATLLQVWRRVARSGFAVEPGCEITRPLSCFLGCTLPVVPHERRSQARPPHLGADHQDDGIYRATVFAPVIKCPDSQPCSEFRCLDLPLVLPTARSSLCWSSCS
jgi:hypothetical protein